MVIVGKVPRYEDWDDPEESWNGFPVLYLSYSKKPVEILKLLKLKPTISQWFDLVSCMTHTCGEGLNEVLAIMPDPMPVMREHPADAGRLLKDLLQTICWSGFWNSRAEEPRVDFCLKLLEEGVRIRWDSHDQINLLRREIYRTANKKKIFRVLPSCQNRQSGSS